MKSFDDRYSQTTDWIVERTPAPERLQVRAHLESWLKTNTAFSRQIGDTLHIGNTGTAEDRALRRSVIFLTRVLYLTTDVSGRVRGAGLSSLRMEFAKLLYRVRLVADQATGTVNLLERVFERELRPHTRAFLEANKLKINGSTTVKGEVNDLPFHFFFRAGDDRFEISKDGPPADLPGAYPFTAVSIPAVDWKQVPGRSTNNLNGSFGQIAGTRLHGASVAVTTQFTGCALCLKEVNGQLYAAHISPSNLTGSNPQQRGPTALADQLVNGDTNVTAGNFANAAGAGTFRVYGAGYSNLPGQTQGYPLKNAQGDMMTIIGFRDAQWKVFSQHIKADRISKVVQVV